MLPLTINGDCVERVPNFHFLWVHIEEALTWGVNTTELLRVLRKDNIAQRLLLSFYRCSIESVLTYCICAWYGCSTAAQRKALQRVINSAPKKSSSAPYPQWRNCTVHAASKERRTLSEKFTILVTACLNCSHQADGTQTLKLKQIGWK